MHTGWHGTHIHAHAFFMLEMQCLGRAGLVAFTIYFAGRLLYTRKYVKYIGAVELYYLWKGYNTVVGGRSNCQRHFHPLNCLPAYIDICRCVSDRPDSA